MENDVLERSVLMDCPACGHRHFVEERRHIVCWSIKGKHIYSKERYYHCPFADDDWQTIEMEEEGSKIAHDMYRIKHGLLTSMDIYHLRVLYRLSQRELEILLELEPNAISYYEQEGIQNTFVDWMLRSIQNHPLQLITLLSSHKRDFSVSRINELCERVAELIGDDAGIQIREAFLSVKRMNINPNRNCVDLHAIWN